MDKARTGASCTDSVTAAADTPSNIELVTRAQQGSRWAREELVVRGLPQLRRWARHRLPSQARGQMSTADLSQEVALLVLGRIEHFDPEHTGSMTAYLRRTAANRIHDEVRRVARRPPCVELADRVPSREPCALAVTIATEERRRYQEGLDQLRPKDRQLIEARVRDGCNLETIARRFRLPSASAAGMAVGRAERRLKQIVSARLARPAAPDSAG